MRLTSFAVISSLIAYLILSTSSYQLRDLEYREYLEIYNKRIIEQASSDARSTLKKSAEIYGGSIVTSSDIDAKLIVDTFLKSMNSSLGNQSDYAKEDLKKYFPLLCVIENDGITLSSYIEIKNSEGVFQKRILTPKYRFFMIDKDIIYYPTLSGELTMLYDEDGLLIEESGTIDDLINRPNRKTVCPLLKKENIKEIFQDSIRKQISSLITEEIERHEREMAKRGFYYDFYLPKYFEESTFHINSPCFIVIMQGYPLGKNLRSNTVNICKMDIKNQGFYGGFIENGIKYYMPASNSNINNKTLIEAFTNEFSALKAGYYKYH